MKYLIFLALLIGSLPAFAGPVIVPPRPVIVPRPVVVSRPAISAAKPDPTRPVAQRQVSQARPVFIPPIFPNVRRQEPSATPAQHLTPQSDRRERPWRQAVYRWLIPMGIAGIVAVLIARLRRKRRSEYN